MPQLVPVVLKHGTDNTASTTYNPRSLGSDGIGKLFDASEGVKALQSTLTISSREVGGSGGQRVILKLTQPHSVVNNGQETVVDNSIGEINLRFAPVSTAAERQLLTQQIEDLMNSDQALIQAIINNQEGLW